MFAFNLFVFNKGKITPTKQESINFIAIFYDIKIIYKWNINKLIT